MVMSAKRNGTQCLAASGTSPKNLQLLDSSHPLLGDVLGQEALDIGTCQLCRCHGF